MAACGTTVNAGHEGPDPHARRSASCASSCWSCCSPTTRWTARCARRPATAVCRTTRTSTWSTWCRGAGARRRRQGPGDHPNVAHYRRPLHPLRPLRAHLPRGHVHRLLGLPQPRLRQRGRHPVPPAAGRRSAACPAGSASAPARWAPSWASGPRRAPAPGRPRRRPPPARTAPTAAGWWCTASATRWCGSSSEERKGLNNGNLCVKGRFAMGYADAADRLTTPLVRNAKGELEEASWDEALAAAKDKHRRRPQARTGGTGCGGRRAGPTSPTRRPTWRRSSCARSSAPTTSTPSTMRDQAASEKALTAAFGVAAVDQLPHRPGGRPTSSWCSAPTSPTPTRCWRSTVIQALRKNKPVIVVDPRSTELAGKAKYHLALKPGTDLAVLRAMMKHILDVEAAGRGRSSPRNTEGFAALESVAGRRRHRRRSGRRRRGCRPAAGGGRGLRPGGRRRHLRRPRC